MSKAPKKQLSVADVDDLFPLFACPRCGTVTVGREDDTCVICPLLDEPVAEQGSVAEYVECCRELENINRECQRLYDKVAELEDKLTDDEYSAALATLRKEGIAYEG